MVQTTDYKVGSAPGQVLQQISRDRLTEFQLNIIATLNYLQHKADKHYSFPSQAKLLFLIERWYGQKRSLRSLNRDLRKLEDQGYISRTNRTKPTGNGCRTFTSTLYMLCHRAYKYIGSFVRKLSCHTRQAFKRPLKKQSPGISVEVPGPVDEVFLDREENLARFRGLLKTMA